MPTPTRTVTPPTDTSVGSKSRTENFRPEHITTVTTQIANYHKLRDLIDQWIDTGIELDRLRRHPPR